MKGVPANSASALRERATTARVLEAEPSRGEMIVILRKCHFDPEMVDSIFVWRAFLPSTGIFLPL